MTFEQKLKAHRSRLDITQPEAAAILEISYRALWQWENGKPPHILMQEAALARLEKAPKKRKSLHEK